MNFAILALPALAVALSDDVAPPRCTADARAPALDHVVIAVRDLDAASAPFRALGFQLKAGRLHANNLLNRHVKFRNHTSLELMTVRGKPGDAMASDYAELIAAGEGGVYLALNVANLDTVVRHADALGLTGQRSASGVWKFLSFAGDSPAAAVFFSAGNAAAVRDPDSLLTHRPRVVGLTEVWLEAGPEFGKLLERLGARHCGAATSPRGYTGERFALSRGSVIIVSSRTHIRPRVRGVTLQLERAGNEATIWPHAEFWVQYKFDQQ